MSADEMSVAAPVVCDCGGQVRWEAIVEGFCERWLGTCECGVMRAFLPDQPDCVPDDPLRSFLAGPEVTELPGERPPWVRLILMSGQEPFCMEWTHLRGVCASCQSQTRFAGRRTDAPRAAGQPPIIVCLGCGLATVPNKMRGPARFLTGDEWTPPCPAVKRLRRIAFSRPVAIRIDE